MREADHRAWWVGGCVRDALLELEPKDIDIVTDASPEQIRALFPRTIAIGAKFGVICVMENGVATEVATFRSDGEYLDSRHPDSVAFGSPEEDAARRDFTINALMYDPFSREIVDHAGGRNDLDARILRAIGDPEKRFREDALRLLRAVRFASRFDLAIEPRTRQAISDLAPTITHISAERIRDEIIHIFTGPRPAAGLSLLDGFGLLEPILPEVAAMKGVAQPPAFHPEGDVFLHTCLALDNLPPKASPALAIGVLLHDIGKPPTYEEADRIRFNKHHAVGAEMADEICRRLRFSNADRKRIVAIVDQHMRFMDVTRMKPSTLRQFLAQDGFDEHLQAHRADCLASHGDLDNYRLCLAKLEEFLREADKPGLPLPLITGHDLIAVGYPPGPRMGEILGAVREKQLDGELHSLDQALEWVKETFPASRSG
ncbi:CCA tRNA nucleotidyltransferase [bacterium]|nr:CCA tRNA nucleotidyltransferase [bacterium]